MVLRFKVQSSIPTLVAFVKIPTADFGINLERPRDRGASRRPPRPFDHFETDYLQAPLGAADYIAICKRFPRIIVRLASPP